MSLDTNNRSLYGALVPNDTSTRAVRKGTWGKRLREFRARRDESQADLSKRSGVSIWMISQTEIGNRVLSLRLQERLARAYDVPREVLFPEEPDEAVG